MQMAADNVNQRINKKIQLVFFSFPGAAKQSLDFRQSRKLFFGSDLIFLRRFLSAEQFLVSSNYEPIVKKVGSNDPVTDNPGADFMS